MVSEYIDPGNIESGDDVVVKIRPVQTLLDPFIEVHTAMLVNKVVLVILKELVGIRVVFFELKIDMRVHALQLFAGFLVYL